MKTLNSLLTSTVMLASLCCLPILADASHTKKNIDTKPKFYPLPNGQPGIMDQKMKDFLESTADNPTQHSLDSMLQRVDMITVKGSGGANFSTDDVAKIEAFKRSLKILEDPKTFNHCMCYGDPQIYLYSGNKQIAHLSCQHGSAIRWNDGWKWDANLKDGSLLTEWLAVNGAPQLKEDIEDARKRAEKDDRDLKRWLATMPPCLMPYAKELSDWTAFNATSDATGKPTSKRQHSKFSKYWTALDIAYPDTDLQILALLTWFGSGSGPWSGFPSYEQMPEQMLAELDTREILHAVLNKKLSETQLEGTARYFAGWEFHQKKNELSLVPADFRRKLLEHTLKSANELNIGRARGAFDR